VTTQKFSVAFIGSLISGCTKLDSLWGQETLKTVIERNWIALYLVNIVLIDMFKCATLLVASRGSVYLSFPSHSELCVLHFSPRHFTTKTDRRSTHYLYKGCLACLSTGYNV